MRPGGVLTASRRFLGSGVGAKARSAPKAGWHQLRLTVGRGLLTGCTSQPKSDTGIAGTKALSATWTGRQTGPCHSAIPVPPCIAAFSAARVNPCPRTCAWGPTSCRRCRRSPLLAARRPPCSRGPSPSLGRRGGGIHRWRRRFVLWLVSMAQVGIALEVANGYCHAVVGAPSETVELRGELEGIA